jgi:hypothetical protein
MKPIRRKHYKLKNQYQLPNLHPKLRAELEDGHSQISRWLEYYHFSSSKIPSSEFGTFYNYYKPSYGARLRLFYLHLVVKKNWGLLRQAFRIKRPNDKCKICRDVAKKNKNCSMCLGPLNCLSPRGSSTDLPPHLEHINAEELFLLNYKIKIPFVGCKGTLSLVNWAEAAKFSKSESIPDSEYEKFRHCYALSKKRDGNKELTKAEDILLRKRWDEYFLPKYVENNYNQIHLLIRQHIPARKYFIDRRNTVWGVFSQYWLEAKLHFEQTYRLNQHIYEHKNSMYVPKDDKHSLFRKFGITNYAKYICTIMNSAWIYFSEECSDLHYTEKHKRGSLKGLGGHGNGYARLGAARIIAEWNDEEKLKQLKAEFPNILCIRPFETIQQAKEKCFLFESNFIVPDNETIDARDKDESKSIQDDEEDVLEFGRIQGRVKEYASIKESKIFLTRDKNPERANTLWRSVVRKNHRLQHKFFPQHECDTAASYILRWLVRPRI